MLLFSLSVVSDSMQPHGLQHARLSCPSPFPRACSNSCPLSGWCHPTISSYITRFSCPQSFPASRSFPMSQLFTSGGQSIEASALVLPMNIQGWFLLGLAGLISLDHLTWYLRSLDHPDTWKRRQGSKLEELDWHMCTAMCKPDS